MKCNYCGGNCIKKGKRKGVQKYQCSNCNKYQQKTYTRLPFRINETMLIKLNNEGVGIRSIARILEISKTIVQRYIEKIANKIKRPDQHESNQSYEIDELRTYIGKKKNVCWVIYAINQKTGKVIDIAVGRRTKANLKKVIDAILALNPKRIYTDRLNSYPTLIPNRIHRFFQYCTNRIERKNLSLRTHLKRLSRKTICFSKNQEMLESCLKLYCWSNY